MNRRRDILLLEKSQMAVIRETRPVSNFDEVALQGTGEIRLTQSDTESLVIETEESVLSHIKSEVFSGRLELGPKSWLDTIFMLGVKIIFHLSVKNLRALSISGSGDLNAGALHSDRLRLSISGSGDIDIQQLDTSDLELTISGAGKACLAGVAHHLDLRVSGSGNLQAGSLDTVEVSVHISGSGETVLKVQQRLDVHISGSGEVKYSGSPVVNQRISGVGHIIKV